MKTKQYIGKPVEFPHFPHGRWKPNKLSRFDSTEKAQEVPKNILIKDLKKKKIEHTEIARLRFMKIHIVPSTHHVEAKESAKK